MVYIYIYWSSGVKDDRHRAAELSQLLVASFVLAPSSVLEQHAFLTSTYREMFQKATEHLGVGIALSEKAQTGLNGVQQVSARNMHAQFLMTRCFGCHFHLCPCHQHVESNAMLICWKLPTPSPQKFLVTNASR